MKGTDRFYLEGVGCLFDGALLPVVNLSVGGFFVACERPPMAGQVLQLVLVDGPRQHGVLGQVSWINDHRSPRKPHLPGGFGVHITRIAFADKLALLAMLRRAAETRRPTRG